MMLYEVMKLFDLHLWSTREVFDEKHSKHHRKLSLFTKLSSLISSLIKNSSYEAKQNLLVYAAEQKIL